MQKKKVFQKLMSIILCISMLAGYLPEAAMSVSAANELNAVGTVADPGTADAWEEMLGTEKDGNRYSGRVWVDKSVYKDGDTAVLNSKEDGSESFEVSLENDEDFQVIFSALGSSMTTTSKSTSTGPMDVVIVIDGSTSMDDVVDGKTRLERVITAANTLIDDLLSVDGMRLSVVTYNKDSETVLPLAEYNNGVTLKVFNYYNNYQAQAGVIYAYDDNNKQLGKDSGYIMGTNLQSGIDRGFNILADASDVEGRTPVAIVLTDGQANRASKEGFYEISSHEDKDGTGADVQSATLATLLNAAYNKTKVEAHYGTTQKIYSVSVDLNSTGTDDESVVANAIMNPAHATRGFHSNNSNADVKQAVQYFEKWASGQYVTFNDDDADWIFDHNYPRMDGAITREKIAANINYVDTDSHYDVSSADLELAFEQIYKELTSGVFNPISSSTTVDGATSVEDTPLIYVDFIGQHMEVKEIQAVTLFGQSYGVVKNSDGTYTVAAGTGTNPTTNETWNTSEDIRISVTEQTDGTQKLEVKINQEILPILLKQVNAETVNGTTSATITDYSTGPLRVYYTVGLSEDIILPNGELDASKLQGYKYLDETNGTASFYSNQFGVMNTADASGIVTAGDAHVGFQPSEENRYYYHQANQGIFSSVTNIDGSAVEWEEDLYGVAYEEDKYELTYLTYDDYKTFVDDKQVYTYVSFYRPTVSTTDVANAAEEVIYLVYTDWGYLKESVAFYDYNVGKFINYDSAKGYVTGDVGYAPAEEQVEAMISAYVKANPNADIKAMLGVGSLRTSRFHNMEKAKDTNSTGTAALSYEPEYTHEMAEEHNDNDVVVWLGNNGKLTVKLDTGIALTKKVTEAIGNADDTYALTVTVPSGVEATPVVKDVNGNTVTASYTNNVLTVNLKANETVYISGIPAGTTCAVDEMIPTEKAGEYKVSSKTDSVTVPTAAQVIEGVAKQYVEASVTNTPIKTGNLYITKEISSDHTIPDSVNNTAFSVTVNAPKLAGQTIKIKQTANAELVEKTFSNDGNLTLEIKAKQTIELLDIPEGIDVTVTETLKENSNFTVSYRTRNHSGAEADGDGKVTIQAGANATAVIINEYTPKATTVDLDIAGTKNFVRKGDHDGGSFTFKVQKWNGNAWEDINGKTATVPYEQNEAGEKRFTIENVLAGITYANVGSWAYQVVEVKGSVENVTYDRTLYTFTVTVTDNDGQLVATVKDLNNQTITNESDDEALDYKVTFNNTYHTAPVSIDIVKEVENTSGDSSVSKAGFDFEAVQTDENWDPLTGEQASKLIVSSDAVGEARVTATYKDAGTYYYVLKEVNEKVPGWTYSNAEYHVTVTVKSDETFAGNLIASMNIEKVGSNNEKETAKVDANDSTKGTVKFVNTYDPEDITVNLDGKVKKTLAGKKLTAGMFTFYVYKNGERDDTSLILTGTNDLNGNVEFVDFNKVLTFDKVGKYEYDIVEAIPKEAVKDEATGKYILNGMTYDPTIYDLVVEVTNDKATGKLSASYYFEDAVGDVVTFENSYETTPTEYVLGGVKELMGRAPKAGEFSFELYEVEGETKTHIDTVSNKADGSFEFAKINYDTTGTYKYLIKEVVPTDDKVAGVEYDSNEFAVEVTVVDENGELKASCNKENTAIKFANTYTPAPVSVTFNVNKTWKGNAEDTCTFQLYSTDSSFGVSGANMIGEVSAANGTAAIKSIKFEAPGTYFYTIIEDTSVQADGIVYDTTHHNYIVTISDIGDGFLKASVLHVNSGNEVSGTATANAENAVITAPTANFTNATFDEVAEKEVFYKDKTTTSIDGKKVKEGEILTYFINYTNYTGADTVVEITDIIPDHTTYVEGSASHDGTCMGDRLNWTLTVAKGESVQVSFDVKVDKTSVIIANTATIRDGVNTYTTNEVTNHTIEDVVEKDVFYPTDPTVSIDGKKVYEGEELLYTISYINASRDKADIEITDKIPEYTTYVEGSADNDGVYKDGTLTWEMKDIAPWSKVTVSFKVKVNDLEKAAEITNIANVYDGKNRLTDKVTNYTVKDETEKDVAFADKPNASIDGKEVETGDELLYTIEYKNTDKESVNVQITDKVPQYTTYAEGSADHDGVCENGVVSWNLEVPAGETVKVSFKVTVDDVYAETIENEAKVVEGKNEYTTNEVTNTKVNELEVFIAIQKMLEMKEDVEHTLGGFEFELRYVADNNNVVKYDRAVSDNEGNTGYILQLRDEDLNKTYKYELVEINQGVEGMTYDTTVHEIEIMLVVDSETGKLAAKIIQDGVAVDEAKVVFNNIYEGDKSEPDEPEDPGKVVETNPTKTGDEATIVTYLFALLISLIAAFVALIVRRRNSYRR